MLNSKGGGASGKQRLIFPLDVASADEAMRFVDELGGSVGLFKVGLELFIAEGPAIVRRVADHRPVFLDLKLHDIPETVDRAIARACDLGVRMLTIHATGGGEMLARAAKRTAGTSTELLAVTVLTALGPQDLEATGVRELPGAQTLRLAKLAWEMGVRGIVCSAEEVAEVRRVLGPDATLVTPGIRPTEDRAARVEGDDQKRVATPRQAILDGASYLVVGRPIREAKDCRQSAERIVQEIVRAESELGEGENG